MADFIRFGMEMSDGLGLGDPTTEQTTWEEEPDFKRARRRVLRILLNGFIGLLALGGVHRLWTAREGWEYSVGAVFAMIGMIQVVVWGRRAVVRVIGNRRLMRGCCPRCGYEMMAFATGRCPECGEDPFEW